MTRSRGGINSRKSRNYGTVSGVTIVTNPSGVTIYKNQVETTNGYLATYVGSGLKIATGVTNVASKATGQTFTGITTIKHVQLTPIMAKSAVTGVEIAVGGNKEWSYASGTTQINIYVYTYKGAAYSSAVSIAYTVIGT